MYYTLVVDHSEKRPHNEHIKYAKCSGAHSWALRCHVPPTSAFGRLESCIRRIAGKYIYIYMYKDASWNIHAAFTRQSIVHKTQQLELGMRQKTHTHTRAHIQMWIVPFKRRPCAEDVRARAQREGLISLNITQSIYSWYKDFASNVESSCWASAFWDAYNTLTHSARMSQRCRFGRKATV